VSLASDLVGTEIMSGDPDAVSLLAKRMSHLAHDVNAMRDKFSARYLGGIWQGPAFEAFADTLEDVPKDLEKVSTSYTMASSALDSFHVALADVQHKARELARQSTDAQSRVNTADGDRTRAKREVKLAKSAVLAASDPVAKQDAQRRLQQATTALGGAEQRHGQASSELDGVHSSANAAVETFQAEVKLCCQRLHDASEAGIQNSPLSWYNRNIANGPIGILLSPLTDLADLRHIIDIVKNPGDLAAWRGFLDGLGAVVLLAAVAVIVIGTGGTALLVVGAIGVGIAAASLAVDAERARRGDIPASALGGDLLSLGLSAIPFAGKTLPKYMKALNKASGARSKTWVTRYKKYGLSGQHVPKDVRLKQLRDKAVKTYAGRGASAAYHALKPPDNLEPCLVPHPGLGASPNAVIRHTRPIVPRPIALAHAA
jgi:uncharacterized protein YukE